MKYNDHNGNALALYITWRRNIMVYSTPVFIAIGGSHMMTSQFATRGIPPQHSVGELRTQWHEAVAINKAHAYVMFEALHDVGEITNKLPVINIASTEDEQYVETTSGLEI